jgi:hypothetical protein
MPTISIQFKMDAMSFNIFSKMEPNLNKKQFLQKQYASFINYEPAKS